MSEENKKENKINIQIVTPYELFYKGEIDELIVPATDGEIGILSGHTPLIIALNPGELRIKKNDETMYISVSSGYAQVEFDQAIVVVSAAEWPDKIDIKRAQHALERSMQRLKDPSTPAREIERSKRSLMRAKARLKVAEKGSKTLFERADSLID